MKQYYIKNKKRLLKNDKLYRKTKEYQDFKLNRIKFNREIIDHFKNQPCLDCHKKFPPECMDFDHVYGEKIMNVSQMLMQSVVRIINEISKCEVVCSNCHRIRSRSAL